MRRVAWLALWLVGCGSGGDDNNKTPDAGPTADAAIRSCDVFKSVEECTMNASRPKCAVTVSQGVRTTRCVEQNGTLVAGAICTRGSQPGVDDCEKGLFCSGLGLEADENGTAVRRACRSYCVDDTVCAEKQRCATLITNPRVGICVPAGCTLFDSTCPANTTCDAFVHFDGQNFVGLCRALGAVALGGDCASDDCVAGTRCFAESPSMFRCKAQCDDTHACATGTCMKFAGMTGGAGLCQ